MAITTLANVKLILGIEDTSSDSLIEMLIPMVEADYLFFRNKPFDVDEEGITQYPANAELVAIRMLDYLKDNDNFDGSIASEGISRYSVVYGTMTRGYPDTIVGMIERYVRFV